MHWVVIYSGGSAVGVGILVVEKFSGRVGTVRRSKTTFTRLCFTY